MAQTPDMDERTLTEIISTLLHSTTGITNSLVIGFTGGEPLLNFSAVPKSYDFLYKRYPQLKNMRHTFSTNLTVLPEAFLDFMRENRNFWILYPLTLNRKQGYTETEKKVFLT
jgi:sulfatase maturation enzyme AslB (radical SAM superfamily)